LLRKQCGPDSNGNLGNFNNYWFLLFREGGRVSYTPVLNQTVITSSPGTTQTITSDSTWSNTVNIVEAIGAGTDAAKGAGNGSSGAGGGGGAYTSIKNMQFATPGTTQAFVRVGADSAPAGTVGDSWLTQTSPGTTYPVSAQVGLGAKGATPLASTTTTTSGAGGASASAYTNPATDAITTSGGASGAAGGTGASGGGGGGAGGDDATGGAGGAGPGAGGSGNNGIDGGGAGGSAGNPGTPGGDGLNINRVQGSGGGGGGANALGGTGGAGGLYGGGGGGGGRATGTAGVGKQGIVVLSWSPLMAQAVF